MALRITLAVVPLAAVVVLVLLLNSLDANTGLAVAALGFVAVAAAPRSDTSPTVCPSSERPAAATPTAPDASRASTTATAEQHRG